MTEDQIKRLLLTAFSSNANERVGQEALAQLATQFLVNQQRIADSLDKLSFAVDDGQHGYSFAALRTRTTA